MDPHPKTNCICGKRKFEESFNLGENKLIFKKRVLYQYGSGGVVTSAIIMSMIHRSIVDLSIRVSGLNTSRVYLSSGKMRNRFGFG